MSRLAVAHFLERWPAGTEFPAGRLPLHLTLAGNFTVDADADAILTTIAGLGLAPTTARVGKTELFGRSGNVQVRVIERVGALRDIHSAIVNSLTGMGATFDTPGFNLDGFRPHITEVPGQTIPETVTVDSVTVIDLRPEGNRNLRRILGTAVLSS